MHNDNLAFDCLAGLGNFEPIFECTSDIIGATKILLDKAFEILRFFHLPFYFTTRGVICTGEFIFQERRDILRTV